MSERESLAPRDDFPLLARRIEGKPIVYLDSAATSLKPRAVIDAVVRFYESTSANVHRGNHTLSDEASRLVEDARDAVARFVGANAREVVFTANATDAIHLVAEGLGLVPGDNVVTTMSEHHSNILPWLSRGEARFVADREDGTFDLEALDRLIDAKTKLVAVSHVSNVTGAVRPIRAIIARAKARGVPVLVDGSQSVPHLPIDVEALGCDCLVFSGHKMLGPSGVGVLVLRESLWERVRPTKIGGGTVLDVGLDGYSLKRVPHCFEAGTPNIEGILGLGAAVAYLDAIGMDRVAAHDAHLARAMARIFGDIPGVRLLGPRPGDAHDGTHDGGDSPTRIAIASLVPQPPARIDVAMIGMMLSDSFAVMARTGTHCAHPYFRAIGVPGALRFSAYVYTTEAELRFAASALATIVGA